MTFHPKASLEQVLLDLLERPELNTDKVESYTLNIIKSCKEASTMTEQIHFARKLLNSPELKSSDMSDKTYSLAEELVNYVNRLEQYYPYCPF